MTRAEVQEIRAAAAYASKRFGGKAGVVMFYPQLKQQQQQKRIRLQRDSGPWGEVLYQGEDGASAIFPADVLLMWAKATDEIMGAMEK